jgi:hypothetical protein
MSRVETKVWAAVVGGGGGTVIGNALLWVLGVTAWGAPSDAGHSKAALDAVPPYISSLITLGVATIGTFAAGWYAPPSTHAGNAIGGVMDDSGAGHPDLSDDDAEEPVDGAGASGDGADLDDDDEREVDSDVDAPTSATGLTRAGARLAEGP